MAKRLPVRNPRRHEGKTGVTKFKELCMDTAHSGGKLGRFWASVTGCSYVEPSTPDESGDVTGRVEGQVEGTGIAMCLVPEPMTVKNRIHWDLYDDVDDLVVRGATALAELPGSKVLADPEGNEFSVFVPPPGG
jgi:hypothetical protein